MDMIRPKFINRGQIMNSRCSPRPLTRRLTQPLFKNLTMDAEWDDLSLTDSQLDTVFAAVDAAAEQHYNNQTMDVEWDDLSLTDSQLDTVFAAADATEDQHYENNDLNDSVCVDDDDDDDDDENKVANLDQLRQRTAKPKKQYIRLRKNLVLVKTAWDFPWEEETNSSEENGTVGSTSTLTGSSSSV
ncbi:uncharacterized protein [Ptychodera flava]|uniref:uncharacterized protein n=1 Tax=Ptychodera flava TaxID=63121 RepID=UPI00396A2487